RGATPRVSPPLAGRPEGPRILQAGPPRQDAGVSLPEDHLSFRVVCALGRQALVGATPSAYLAFPVSSAALALGRLNRQSKGGQPCDRERCQYRLEDGNADR